MYLVYCTVYINLKIIHFSGASIEFHSVECPFFYSPNSLNHPGAKSVARQVIESNRSDDLCLLFCIFYLSSMALRLKLAFPQKAWRCQQRTFKGKNSPNLNTLNHIKERQPTRLMAVEVVLSSGGNQRLEMRGGAAMMVTPEIPFRIEQMWQLK